MLTKLRIKNFKCLQDTGDLDIRPLTFLVGPNSSGKSSVLQFLLMLRQTVDSTDIENPLVTRNGWVELGAYPEFIFKGEKERELTVEVAVTRQSDNGAADKSSLEAVFFYQPETTVIRLRRSDVHTESGLHRHIQSRGNGEGYEATYSMKRAGKVVFSEPYVHLYKFYGTVSGAGAVSHDLSVTDLQRLVGLGHAIAVELRNTFYIGPLRGYPQRVYVTSGQAPQDVGIKGERAVDVLWFIDRSRDKNLKRVFDEVRHWAKQLGIARNLHLDRMGENYYRLMVVDPATGMEVNLADIGFGASQALPIIIECFYAPQGSAVLIEQPEIHLHPKAQSVLGDLFIEAAKDSDRTFIVETHSEHILNRVCRRIAERKITKEQVAIYYFKPGKDGTRIQRVTINDDGQYEKFPKGFFEEDLAEALEHLKAMQLAR